MPDWFYRTVSRPILFRLPARTARDFALGFVGNLARLPGGGFVIDLLGHMRPDPRLRKEVAGITFPGSVGLGVGVDARILGLPALARFGIGFIEVGPIRVCPQLGQSNVVRRCDQLGLWYPDGHAALGLEAVRGRLAREGLPGVPLLFRLAVNPGSNPDSATEECRKMIAQLTPFGAGFSIATTEQKLQDGWSEQEWRSHLRSLAELAAEEKAKRPIFLCLPADLKSEDIEAVVGPVPEIPLAGVVVDGSIAANPSGRLIGQAASETA